MPLPPGRTYSIRERFPYGDLELKTLLMYLLSRLVNLVVGAVMLLGGEHGSLWLSRKLILERVT